MHHPRNLARRLRAMHGQGTVEYVGIVIAIGALLLALGGVFGTTSIAKPIASKITAAVSHAIDGVVASKGSTR